MEGTGSYYARNNLRGKCGFVLVIDAFLITAEVLGWLPEKFESGLWWELLLAGVCIFGISKTGGKGDV